MQGFCVTLETEHSFLIFPFGTHHLNHKSVLNLEFKSFLIFLFLEKVDFC